MIVDNVNGLCYLAIRWMAHASLLPKSEMEDLEAALKRMAASEHDPDDSIALRCFATAVQNYLKDLP